MLGRLGDVVAITMDIMHLIGPKIERWEEQARGTSARLGDNASERC
jgi:hypothetical protein